MTHGLPPPASLAELIDLEVVPRRVWRANELGAVLRHELSLPPTVALRDLRAGSGPLPLPPPAATAGGTPRGAAPTPETLGDLLVHVAPPLELLVQVKRHAKAARHDPQGHLPEDVAAVLYALAIAVALLRHGRRITSMSAAATATHLGWAAGRSWLDAASRDVLLGAVRQLEREQPQPQPPPAPRDQPPAHAAAERR